SCPSRISGPVGTSGHTRRRASPGSCRASSGACAPGAANMLVDWIGDLLGHPAALRLCVRTAYRHKAERSPREEVAAYSPHAAWGMEAASGGEPGALTSSVASMDPLIAPLAVAVEMERDVAVFGVCGNNDGAARQSHRRSMAERKRAPPPMCPRRT